MESTPSSNELHERQEMTARKNHNQSVLALFGWYLENGDDEEKKKWDDHVIHNAAMMNWVEKGYGPLFDAYMNDSEHSQLRLNANNSEEIQKVWSDFQKHLSNTHPNRAA